MRRWYTKRQGNPVYGWLSAAIRKALTHTGQPNPQTVADVGCATGELLGAMDWLPPGKGLRLGVDVTPALEPAVTRYATYIVHDLERPWHDDGVVYDLVCCIEVAEHLRAGDNALAAMPLWGTLDAFSGPGSVLVFSAATPAQRGHGHVNAHSQRVWAAVLEARGWRYNHEATMVFAYTLGQLTPGRGCPVGRCHRNNTMVFERP